MTHLVVLYDCLVSGTSIDFFILLGLVVNKIKITNFSRIIPCLNRGRNEHLLEICFRKDKESMELEKVKFSSSDIKKHVVFNSQIKIAGFSIYGCQVQLKEKNLEIEMIVADELNSFRKNIAKRFLREALKTE